MNIFDFMYIKLYFFYFNFGERTIPRISSNILLALYFNLWIISLESIVDKYIIHLPESIIIGVFVPYVILTILNIFVFFPKSRHEQILHKYMNMSSLMSKYMNFGFLFMILILIIFMIMF